MVRVSASVVGLLCALLPFWMSVVPPMTDVSQHILVARIVREFSNTPFAFSHYFSVDWTGAPTDLFYLLLSGIQRIVGPFTDARVYLSFFVIALWGSVLFLARAFHKDQAWISALAALPIAFCWYVYMGLLPFLATLPLFALAVGVWVRPIAPHWKVLILWPLLVALFGFHVVGAAATAAVIGILALWEARARPTGRMRPVWTAAIALLPVPFLLLRYLTGEHAPSVQVAHFDLVKNTRDFLHYTAASLATPVQFLMLTWMAGLGVVALASVRAKRTPTALLVAAATLSLIGVVAPSSLGALWPAGPRLLPFALLLGAADLAVSDGLVIWFAGTMVCLLLALGALTAAKARQLDAPFRDFLSGAEHVLPGSKILPVLVDPSAGSRDITPFWTLASSYLVLRGGASPYVFAQPYIKTGASPVHYRDRSDFPFAYLLAPRRTPADYRGVACCYDYVLLWGRDSRLEAVLGGELQLVHEQGDLRLYAAHK